LKRFIRILSAAVRKAPVPILIGAIVLTVVFGAFIPQQERAVGNEGFSPDSDEFLAAQTIDDIFTASSEVAVQILISAGDGNIITADGIRAYAAVRQAVLDSRASEIMGHRADGDPEGDISGFYEQVLVNLEAQGIDLASLDDAAAVTVVQETLADLPPDSVDAFLFPERAEITAGTSPSGLMVVFLALSKLEDDPDQIELQAIEIDMADAVREAAAGSPGEVTAESFSFALLFANQDEFEAEVGRLFGTAFLIILIILGFVFWIHPRGRLSRLGAARRAGADVLLALAVIIMSIGWMNGIGVLLGPKYLGLIGKFSELLQVIPILLVGLGVDYAIHLTSRYREEVGAGADVVESATRASRTVGVALVLATVTTAVGFLTNIFNPVTAIADFGILASVGIGSAFLLMLTFVPAVLILLDRRAERAGTLPVEAMGHSSERLLPRLMGSSSVLADKIPAVMLVIALAGGGLGLWGLTNLSTDFSFTDFVPEGSDLLTTFETLSDEYSGGFGERTQVLLEGEVATPDTHNGLALAYRNMTDTPNVVVFDGRAQAQSPLSILFDLTTPPDQGGNPDVYSPEFAAQAPALGLDPILTVRQGTDVAALYDAAAQFAPDDMARTIAKEGGDYRYLNVSIATQAGEQGAQLLAEDLAADFRLVSELDGVTAVPTNENIISRGVVDALQSSQVSSIAIALAAAMLLLMVTFFIESRRPFLGVLTITPVALVVLWVFGMMALTGISFNPVTAMIAAIAIGIGVPYTIHITHRYQEDRIRTDSTTEAIRSTMTHTGGALAGSAFTTVAGFGILVTSTLKPFQQFGLVVAYAIGFALVAAVLVLPSMLVLWDRWHRRRGDSMVDEEALARSQASLESS
jgi:predicted RND superfamily exporter protein